VGMARRRTSSRRALRRMFMRRCSTPSQNKRVARQHLRAIDSVCKVWVGADAWSFHRQCVCLRCASSRLRTRKIHPL
jgi:hypothetical protein